MEISSLDAFRLARLDLGWWGELRLPVDGPPDHVTFEDASGRAHTFPAADLLGGDAAVRYAFDAEGGRLLLVGERGTSVCSLDLPYATFSAAARLDRWRDPLGNDYDPGGLYWLDLRPIGDEVLVRWECGLLRVRLDGELRWSRTFPCFAHWAHFDGEAAWYEDNLLSPDPSWPARWGYRLTDGARLDAPEG